MLRPHPGLKAQKTGLVITGLGLMTVVASASSTWPRGLVVFEVLLKCFVTLHFLVCRH